MSSSVIVVPAEIDTQVVIVEDETVVSVPADSVSVVGLAEQGPAGVPAPDVRSYDFYKKGVISGPYTSPMRRYIERDGVISNIIVSADTQPVGQPLVLDILRNGVSVYASNAERPTIQVLTNVGTGVVGAAFNANDYMQVAAVSGSAADLTVSVTLQH